MGDGWETKRRRGPGHDWAIIRLGHTGSIKRVVVDTHFYKGNFPDTCELMGAYLPDLGDTLTEAEITASEQWKPILSRSKLQADHIHEYGAEAVADIGPVTHVRYAMHPDGGTMRLRLYGNKG
jgi:allantoicase